MSIAPLETARLHIREFKPSDLKTYHRLKEEDWLEEEREPIESTHEWLEWTVRNYRALEKLHQPPYGDYVIMLKEPSIFLGAIGLVPCQIPWNTMLDKEPPLDWIASPEYGLFYMIFAEHQNKGYATEAAQAVIDFVFGNMHATRVVATTEYDNEASKSVMTKLGMRLLRNPGRDPIWSQVCGVLDNPKLGDA